MSQRAAAKVQPKSAPPVPGGDLQRKCACGQHTDEGECAECKAEKGKLQRFSTHSARPPRVPSIVHQALRSPGQPLDRATRGFMEPRFGANLSQIRTHGPAEPPARSALSIGAHDDVEERQADHLSARVTGGSGDRDGSVLAYDFSRVRVHTGPLAGRSCEAVNARAYTLGHAIVFAPGQYSPASAQGRALLAHELTHVVQQEGRPDLGGTLRRSVSGFFSNIFRTLFRYDFNKPDLESYLTTLEKTGKIEDDFDSDLKARQIVRQRKEFEARLSVKIQTLLAQEMLTGHVAGGDENAVIALFRAAKPEERQEMRGAIGRDNLWNKFGGRNRGIIEALTMDSDDLRDAKVMKRLQGLPEAHLQDYVENAVDPGVKAQAEKILRLRKITTPLGPDTAVGPDGSASLEVQGAEVTFQPDIYSPETTVEGGETGIISLEADSPGATLSNGRVASIDSVPKIKIVIRTRYKPGIDPTGGSSYGRGTAPGDAATSLRFHEGQHGLDHIKFIESKPLPPFKGKIGMTGEEYSKAQADYRKDIRDYFDKLVEYTVKNTDCAGTPISAEGLEKLRLSATFCTDPAR